jgi:hypothetical protein
VEKANKRNRITSVQILGPFSFIYSHVMRRPSLLSARSDLELLYSASQHFRRYMADSPRNKNIAALIAAMYNAASNFVNQARMRASGLGPDTATAEALQKNYSDLPRPPNNENSTTPAMGEYDYSPTVSSSIDPLIMVGNTANLHPNQSFPFGPHGHMQDQFGGLHGNMSPMMSDAEAAAMLAAQQQEFMPPGMTPFPEVMGAAMGSGGWEDWVWQNEMRPPPHG